MQKTILLSLLGWMVCSLSFAQSVDFDHYSTLRSQGTVPEDFMHLASQNYENDKASIEQDANKSRRKTEDKFYLESNFEIYDMLHSGEVTFGDTVSEYLNHVKDLLLRSQPEVRDAIRIYVFRSPEVNAMTFPNGVILFTTGLLAQLDNEAELAFVLCHEFNHYIQHHALNNALEQEKMAKGAGIYRNLKKQNYNFVRFQYTKDLETQADQLGTKLLATTQYDLSAVIGALDVLLYSYLPFDEVPFPKDYFNYGEYVIPDKYFVDSVAAITATEKTNDLESTHPNIEKRKDSVEGIIDSYDNTGRKLYILPQEDFEYVRKICRYDLCESYLSALQYQDAFYNAYLLTQEDSNNLYLKKVMARAIYGYSLYANNRMKPGPHRGYRNVQGESQQVYAFFDKIPGKELNVLAVRYVWNVYRADTTDRQMHTMCDQLMYELAHRNNIKLDKFKTEEDLQNDSLEEVQAIAGNGTETNKQAKIRSAKKKEDYYVYAFSDLMESKQFTKEFEHAGDIEDRIHPDHIGSGREDYVYALRADKIVIVDPIYVKVDERDKNPLQLQASEDARVSMINKIDQCAGALNLQVTYLQPNGIGKQNADTLNDLAVMYNWLGEKITHLDDGIDMLCANSDDLNALAAKYGTDHFAWMGVISFREKDVYAIRLLIFGVFFWPLLPFAIADALNPDFNTYFFTLVANASTGMVEMEFYNLTDLRDLDSIQKSNIYYILSQIKSGQ